MINVTNINTITTRYLDFFVSLPNGKKVSLKNVSENDLRDVNDVLYDLIHFDLECSHYLPLDGDITVALNGDGDDITITIWEGDSDRTMNYPPTKVGWVSCFLEGEIPRVRDSSSLRSITLSVYLIVHPSGINFVY